jgi:hypothetical protein
MPECPTNYHLPGSPPAAACFANFCNANRIAETALIAGAAAAAGRQSEQARVDANRSGGLKVRQHRPPVVDYPGR